MAEKENMEVTIQEKEQLVGLENKNGRGGKRKLPYIFTEQGIAMLSAVLRNGMVIHSASLDTF